MKKFLTPSILLAFTIILASCGSQGPLTEEQQAAKYGLTIERFREEKSAAARMNMSFDEHIKMIQNDQPMDHGDMPMKDMDM